MIYFWKDTDTWEMSTAQMKTQRAELERFSFKRGLLHLSFASFGGVTIAGSLAAGAVAVLGPVAGVALATSLPFIAGAAALGVLIGGGLYAADEKEKLKERKMDIEREQVKRGSSSTPRTDEIVAKVMSGFSQEAAKAMLPRAEEAITEKKSAEPVITDRHPREGGDPARGEATFIKVHTRGQTPAFAGATGGDNFRNDHEPEKNKSAITQEPIPPVVKMDRLEEVVAGAAAQKEALQAAAASAEAAAEKARVEAWHQKALAEKAWKTAEEAARAASDAHARAGAPEVKAAPVAEKPAPSVDPALEKTQALHTQEFGAIFNALATAPRKDGKEFILENLSLAGTVVADAKVSTSMYLSPAPRLEALDILLRQAEGDFRAEDQKALRSTPHFRVATTLEDVTLRVVNADGGMNEQRFPKKKSDSATSADYASVRREIGVWLAKEAPEFVSALKPPQP